MSGIKYKSLNATIPEDKDPVELTRRFNIDRKKKRI